MKRHDLDRRVYDLLSTVYAGNFELMAALTTSDAELRSGNSSARGDMLQHLRQFAKYTSDLTQAYERLTTCSVKDKINGTKAVVHNADASITTVMQLADGSTIQDIIDYAMCMPNEHGYIKIVDMASKCLVAKYRYDNTSCKLLVQHAHLKNKWDRQTVVRSLTANNAYGNVTYTASIDINPYKP